MWFSNPYTQELYYWLTHWGWVMHICISNLIIIGSDNGLAPGRCQAIIWSNDGILLIGTLGSKFSEIASKIHTFSFKKMNLKMSFAKWHPFHHHLNLLNSNITIAPTPAKQRCQVWAKLPHDRQQNVQCEYFTMPGTESLTISIFLGKYNNTVTFVAISCTGNWSSSTCPTGNIGAELKLLPSTSLWKISKYNNTVIIFVKSKATQHTEIM